MGVYVSHFSHNICHQIRKSTTTSRTEKGRLLSDPKKVNPKIGNWLKDNIFELPDLDDPPEATPIRPIAQAPKKNTAKVLALEDMEGLFCQEWKTKKP